MMPTKVRRVKEFMEKYKMAAPGWTVLVAVSGGADSMCLLEILRASDIDLKLIVAHFNHGLRGEESDRDEEFVRNYCRKREIAFFAGSGDVKGEAERLKLGIEESARIMRYSFLQKTAEEQSANAIATAHNADDNVETVIMNMTRGTGLDGLCGIPPVRDNIIRPILCLTRLDIEEFLIDFSIPNIYDSTNSDIIYMRNKIRHNIIPVLRETNSNLALSVLGMTERLREDRDCLDSWTKSVFSEFVYENESLRAKVAELLALPEAIRVRVLRLALEKIGVTGESRTIKAVSDILVSNDPSAMVNLKNGAIARREYNQLVLQKREIKGGFAPVEISFKKPAYIPELGLEIICKEGKIKNSFQAIFFFKSSEICDNITVRSRRAGDKICLAGRDCTKTLKKLFIEEKIPELQRDSIPVITDGKGVIAVMGLGIAERVKPQEGDDILSMTFTKLENL